MISAFEFYNENLKETCNQDLVDIYDQIAPYRIFRINDYKNEPVPVLGDEAWINSTQTFPLNYEILKTIYESDFIKVKLCRNKQTDEQVAIKFIRLMKPSMELKIKNRLDRINREIQIVKELDHLYIIRVIEVIRMVDCVAIVMEYAANGELFEYVRKRQRIPESLAKKIMFQIFLAVDNLHSKGIVHRDLKLENILLDERLDVKVADFGFANYWRHDQGDKDVSVVNLLKTSCGSPCYAAPEIVLKDKGYCGFPVDIWSCGVIMFALLFGHLPFEDQALKNKNHRQTDRKSSLNVFQLYQFISRNALEIPRHVNVSADAIDLIRGMLRCEPGKRMTLSDIFRHSWFANSQFM